MNTLQLAKPQVSNLDGDTSEIIPLPHLSGVLDFCFFAFTSNIILYKLQIDELDDDEPDGGVGLAYTQQHLHHLRLPELAGVVQRGRTRHITDTLEIVHEKCTGFSQKDARFSKL